MTDMTSFYADPFSVPIPMRAPVVAAPVARGADYYDQAAKAAAEQGQKDVATALAKESQKQSIVSWLTSENPLNTQDGSLNPFAPKVGDKGMTTTTKLMLGAAALGVLYILLNSRRR